MAFDHSTFRTNANAVLATLTTLKAEVQAVVDQRQAHLDDPGEDDTEVGFINHGALVELLASYGPRASDSDLFGLLERMERQLQKAVAESTEISP